MPSPVLSWKRGYGDRITRSEIDYFCIGESWKGRLGQKLESEGQRQAVPVEETTHEPVGQMRKGRKYVNLKINDRVLSL
jgi:hypothetical protein